MTETETETVIVRRRVVDRPTERIVLRSRTDPARVAVRVPGEVGPRGADGRPGDTITPLGRSLTDPLFGGRAEPGFDNRDALAAGIAWARANRQALIIPAGVFYVSDAPGSVVDPNQHVTPRLNGGGNGIVQIVGAGSGASFLLGTFAGRSGRTQKQSWGILNLFDYDQVHLSGLTFDGGADDTALADLFLGTGSYPDSTALVEIRDCGDVVLDDVEWTGFAGPYDDRPTADVGAAGRRSPLLAVGNDTVSVRSMPVTHPTYREGPFFYGNRVVTIEDAVLRGPADGSNGGLSSLFHVYGPGTETCIVRGLRTEGTWSGSIANIWASKLVSVDGAVVTGLIGTVNTTTGPANTRPDANTRGKGIDIGGEISGDNGATEIVKISNSVLKSCFSYSFRANRYSAANRIKTLIFDGCVADDGFLGFDIDFADTVLISGCAAKKILERVVGQSSAGVGFDIADCGQVKMVGSLVDGSETALYAYPNAETPSTDNAPRTAKTGVRLARVTSFDLSFQSRDMKESHVYIRDDGVADGYSSGRVAVTAVDTIFLVPVANPEKFVFGYSSTNRIKTLDISGSSYQGKSLVEVMSTRFNVVDPVTGYTTQAMAPTRTNLTQGDVLGETVYFNPDPSSTRRDARAAVRAHAADSIGRGGHVSLWASVLNDDMVEVIRASADNGIYDPATTFPWVSGTSYSVGSVVIDRKQYFRSTTAHVAATINRPTPGADSSNWKYLDPVDYIGAARVSGNNVVPWAQDWRASLGVPGGRAYSLDSLARDLGFAIDYTGTIDMAPVINAVTAALDTSSGPRVIKVGAGLIKIASTVLLRSNIILDGQGITTVFRRDPALTGSDLAANTLFGSDVNGLTEFGLMNCRIDGNRQNDAESFSTFRFKDTVNSASRLRLVRVTIENFSRNHSAISAAGVDEVDIVECTVRNGGGPVSNPLNHGMYLLRCHRVNVINCRFSDLKGAAYKVCGGSAAPADKIILIGNRVDGATRGMQLSDLRYVVAVGNIIENCTTAGISMGTQNGTVSQFLELQSNIIKGCTIGVRVSNSTGVKILGGDIIDCPTGVSLRGSTVYMGGGLWLRNSSDFTASFRQIYVSLAPSEGAVVLDGITLWSSSTAGAERVGVFSDSLVNGSVRRRNCNFKGSEGTNYTSRVVSGGVSASLTAAASAGSTTLSLDDTTGLLVGTAVTLTDYPEDGSTVTETRTVQSLSPVTLTTALTNSYPSGTEVRWNSTVVGTFDAYQEITETYLPRLVADLPSASTISDGARMYASDLGGSSGGGGFVCAVGGRWRQADDTFGLINIGGISSRTIAALGDPKQIRLTGTLTSNVALTLSTSAAHGEVKVIANKATLGSFAVTVNGSACAANVAVTFVFDRPSSTWYRIGLSSGV